MVLTDLLHLQPIVGIVGFLGNVLVESKLVLLSCYLWLDVVGRLGDQISHLGSGSSHSDRSLAIVRLLRSLVELSSLFGGKDVGMWLLVGRSNGAC